MRAARSMVMIAALAAFGDVAGCSSSSGGGAAPSGSCSTKDNCPTYECTCVDGSSVSVNSCTGGTCAGPASLCDGCSSHGGADGSGVTTTPPIAPIGTSPGSLGPDQFSCADGAATCACYQSKGLDWAVPIVDEQACGTKGLVNCPEPACPEAKSNPCCPVGTYCSFDDHYVDLDCPSGVPRIGYYCVPIGYKRCYRPPTKDEPRGDVACEQHPDAEEGYKCDGPGDDPDDDDWLPDYDKGYISYAKCVRRIARGDKGVATCTPSGP